MYCRKLTNRTSGSGCQFKGWGTYVLKKITKIQGRVWSTWNWVHTKKKKKMYTLTHFPGPFQVVSTETGIFSKIWKIDQFENRDLPQTNWYFVSPLIWRQKSTSEFQTLYMYRFIFSVPPVPDCQNRGRPDLERQTYPGFHKYQLAILKLIRLTSCWSCMILRF